MKDKRRYCPLFGKCGGCDYVNEEYNDELLEKYLKVHKCLSRFGKVERILPAEHIIGYRCKVQAVCGTDKDGKFITGIYRKGSHKIVPIRSCILEDGRATAILQTVRQMANRFGIKAYNEDFDYGDLRHVLIRLGYHTNEAMVVLVTGREDFPHKADFVSALHQKNPEIKTICQIVNREKTSMVVPENAKVTTLYGKGYIIDRLCSLDFTIGPTSFYQVNPEQTEVLYTIAMRMAQLRSDDIVIDAYCGTGTIGLIASTYGVEKVLGIESNADAIKDAVANAEINKITNAEFVNADASKYLKEMAKNKEHCSVLFLDPPRAGSTEEFLASVSRVDPDVIVYISCNPDTLQRDLRYIRRFLPYRVRGIQPVDMFPGSSHVETVVLMSRNI